MTPPYLHVGFPVGDVGRVSVCTLPLPHRGHTLTFFLLGRL